MPVLSTAKFQLEYSRLNPEQRLAVDTIDGPVMVIAGAGTGKTQTIAVRIGNILNQTQLNPSNILCLTFTENAAINMRQRLVNLIGPTGFSVRVATFHGFCNTVIKDHPEIFLFSKSESTSLTDVKQIDIIKNILDHLAPSSPLKNINSPYFYLREVIKLISSLKKENISPDKFDALLADSKVFTDLAIDTHTKITSLRASAKTEADIVDAIFSLTQNPQLPLVYRTQIDLYLKYFQQEITKLTELKKSFSDFYQRALSQYPKLLDFSQIYRQYTCELHTQNLFDFEDMILWVITAFKNNPDLLSEYQEKYQYLLVDEFQDTNASQFEIINLLTQNQDSPNIFVVGDDDQSIFRFQGASVENIFQFYKKFENQLQPIVLKNNYRSHQLIIQSSQSVIQNNLSRITRLINNLDKSLVSQSEFDATPINLYQAPNPGSEMSFVAQKIRSLLDSGVKPREIAVLYRANSDADDLAPYLDSQKVDYLRSDTQNILDTIEIQQLIDLITYLENPDNSELLAKILNFRFFHLNSIDLFNIFKYCRKQGINLADCLTETALANVEISHKSKKKLLKIARRSAKYQTLRQNIPATDLFNFVIRKFGLLRYLLHRRQLPVLNQVNRLYTHLKDSLQVEKLTLDQWIKNLNLLTENNLTLNAEPLIKELDGSVRLMTVHKAKGLEFEHVFLIKVASGKWDSAASRELLHPPLGILKSEIFDDAVDADMEEDRRLFYVALTRAKRQLYLSYSVKTNSDKEQLPSIFLTEIDSNTIETIVGGYDDQASTLLSLYSSTPVVRSEPLQAFITDYITNHYRFNITHLNSYLHCPLCFFFKTILHLPQVKTRASSFGTSVHGALNYLFQAYKQGGKLISLETFLGVFEDNLKRENLPALDLADLLHQGREFLTDYYQHYQHEFNGNCLTEHDFKFYGVRLNDIPLTGKIDKIEIKNDHEANVVDYKTGRPDSKYQELREDGDYFRQLVFYKLLCDRAAGFPYTITSGTIDFIQKDQKGNFRRVNFVLTPEHVVTLENIISETFAKIKNLEFAPNRECTDSDHLHYLYEKYFKS